MARSVRARIETRSARLRLASAKAPYWAQLESRLFAGYHRPRSGAGMWWGRVWVGGKYKFKALVTADDYQDADGETVLNWSQAQTAVRAWAAKQRSTGPYTVADAIRDYITDLRARKGHTAASEAEARLRKHLLPVLGHRLLADLTEGDLIDWRNGMVADDDDEEAVRRSRDSANRTRTVAIAAFNRAFTTRRVPDDRAWRRAPPFKDVGVARRVILSGVEQQRLVDMCEPGLDTLVLVGAETGARLGELTSARIRDLDAEAGTLRVHGKTGKREISLPAHVLTLLCRLANGKKPTEHLLTTAAGTPWTESLHSRPFAKAVAKAGLDPKTCFYSLRHSYVSHALRAGIPTHAVATHCGTSAAMLERHYAKWIKTDLARYAEMAASGLRAGAA